MSAYSRDSLMVAMAYRLIYADRLDKEDAGRLKLVEEYLAEKGMMELCRDIYGNTLDFYVLKNDVLDALKGRGV